MKRPVVALVAALCVRSTLALSRYCSNQDFCILGGTDAATNDVYITIQSASQGWTGWGIGTSMKGATMYVMWKNSTGGVIISERSSTGHIMPALTANSIAVVVPTPADIDAPAWANLVVTFKRPATAATSAISASSNYIFAWSGTSPMTPDSPTSGFPIHDAFGTIGGLDLTTAAVVVTPGSTGPGTKNGTGTGNGSGGTVPPIIDGGQGSTAQPPVLKLPDNISYDIILRAHGIIMVCAWTVSPAIGIFIARYLKDALGVWWFRLHAFFMLVATTLLSVTGIIVVGLYKSPPHFQGDWHRTLGLVLAISTVLQVVLGIVSDRLFSPSRKIVPWWDKMHWWFGRLLVIVAIITQCGGLVLYTTLGYGISVGVLVAYAAIYVVIVVAFVLGEYYLGQVHHVNGKGIPNHEQSRFLS